MGYEQLEAEAKLLYILLQDEEGYTLVDTLEAGEEGDYFLIFDQTPFYAESGGQVADHGVITGADAKVEVFDCQKTNEDIFLHRVFLAEGVLESGRTYTLKGGS